MILNSYAARAGAVLCCFAFLFQTGLAQAMPYESMFGGYAKPEIVLTSVSLDSESSGISQTAQENGCLAKALYFEARGENRLGRIAVAQVILNRVRSPYYPDTICGVVWENAARRNACQFSFACDGKSDRPRAKRAWQEAKMIADFVLGSRPCLSRSSCSRPERLLNAAMLRSTHYHADYVQPFWSHKLRRAGKIGRHIFYIAKKK